MSFGASIPYSQEKTNGDNVGTAASKPDRVVVLFINQSDPRVCIRDKKPAMATRADLVDLYM
jgi:hypothetical protein